MPLTREAIAQAVAGRYVIDRHLGRSGTSMVFLARPVGGYERVAIKVLHPDLSATFVKRRFHREITLLRKLEHRHILPILESEEAGTLIYYVTKYAAGGSLAALLGLGERIPVDQVLTVVREVGAALDYAHSQNVLHRDIKPGNILFDVDRVLVCDFGIAGAIEKAAGDESSSGMVLGTAAYMSPEQARGVRPLDRRSDIYALGCVAYEMLAGQPPFTGATPQAVVARQAQQPPPRVGVLRPDLPPHVEAVLLQALAKDPADRPPSGAEFARRLAGDS
jgi:eukaryotic-like serine/threonine-protein kinase